jgi:hypothetical protein
VVLPAFFMAFQGNRIKEIVNHNYNQCKGSLSDVISCTPIFPCEGIDPLTVIVFWAPGAYYLIFICTRSRQ